MTRKLFKTGCDRGTVATEFAFVVPILFFALVAVSDLALAWWVAGQLSNGARAGVQYALSNSSDASGISAAVRNAGIGDGVTSSPSFSVSSRRFCECAGEGEVSCGSGCASGEPSRMFVEVTANVTYLPLFPYPVLGDALPLSGSAVLQVQ